MGSGVRGWGWGRGRGKGEVRVREVARWVGVKVSI